MLWSVNLKINDEDLELKIGVRELIKIRKAGMNINSTEDMSDEENICKMFKMAVKNKEFKDLDAVIDYIDESDVSFKKISETIIEAIELGVLKEKKNNEPKNQ